MRRALLILAFVSTLSQAAPPAAPQPTVGANEIKQLQFDWPAVPQANYYELWFKANDGAAWSKYAETPAQRPQVRVNVSVHLLDWRVAKYRVAACNPTGCTDSNELGVSDLVDEMVGYIKGTTSQQSYGEHVAMSADGATFAAMAKEAFGDIGQVATIHVYRKTSSTWRREVRLLPIIQRATAQPDVGTPLALSADGNLLAVGLFAEDANGPTYFGEDAGAVYLYRRVGTVWHLEQKLSGIERVNGLFGATVDLDDAGQTLAVWQEFAGGIAALGTTSIYSHTGSGWTKTATIANTVPSGDAPDCHGISLSGDGRRLFRTCMSLAPSVVQVFDAPSWALSATVLAGVGRTIDSTADGTQFVTWSGPHRAAIYRLVSGAWVLEPGTLSFGLNSSPDPAIDNLAISRDGKLVVGGNGDDPIQGSGNTYPPLVKSMGARKGGAYVYERKTAGWKLRVLLKPPLERQQDFGHAIALGNNGKVLVVGSDHDPSAATGIGGNPLDTSAPERGAVWLY